jgi:hypothetical protein
MYEQSVPVFLHFLGNLARLLRKGAAHAELRRVSPEALLDIRLHPEMFALREQVRAVAYHALAAAANLAGQTPPEFTPGAQDFAALLAEVDAAAARLAAQPRGDLEAAVPAAITLQLRRGAVTFTRQHYLSYFVLPNFFFHLATAYDILRHCGVEIGKADFLGDLGVLGGHAAASGRT